MKAAADPLLAPGQTLASVSRDLTAIPLEHPHPRFWWIGFLVSFVG
jgi:hypothetical protein